MTPFETRDAQTAAAIRREIAKLKADAERRGWSPQSRPWLLQFGKIAGLHLALELIDYNANDVLPPLPDNWRHTRG
jgi:hypothetical protein